MANTSNRELAKLLRSVAAALVIKKGSLFQVRAYEGAADAIEHSTSEIKDLWEEGRLSEIPGVGENIKSYLEQIFKKGSVAHFEKIKKGIQPVVFELINIPGIGPKTALELADLGVRNIDDLNKKIKSGELVNKGFSSKIAQKIALAILEVSNRKNRMLLPYAAAQAERILEYLEKLPGVQASDPLGSLRRKVATIGDLDFAVASNDPKTAVNNFVKMPGVARVLSQGDNKATVVLQSGLQVDLLVGDPDSYGALLQHFTGSKHHNIKLRSLAQDKGYSLSEYGVKSLKLKAKSGKEERILCKTEEDLYKLLGMQTPPPEIREDTGEIEASLKGKLPDLVGFSEITGDLHLHSNFPLEPSHGPGVNTLEEIIKIALGLNYKYVGISDHPPAFTTHSPERINELIRKRTEHMSKLKMSNKSIRVLNGLEIDILGDGSLSVPDKSLEQLDYCIAGIHSGHMGTKEDITKRILAAIQNPHVDILAHPTSRILNERDSYDADWEEIFKQAAKYKKVLEINAFPIRLDLRDDLVRKAGQFGVYFIINTDAHEISQMKNMRFGVAVARRGWAESKMIVNTWGFKDFAKWFNIK